MGKIWIYPANIRLDEDVFKMSWSRRICSPQPNVFRRRLQDVLVKTNIFVLAIRLQDVFKTPSRRLAKRRLQDVLREVLKMSSRRLGRRKIVTLKMCWRRFQDMSWRPTNVCWVETEGKINLLVTFIQSVVTQSKLSLIFTKTLYLHIKQPIFRVTYMTHSRMQMSQSFIYLS